MSKLSTNAKTVLDFINAVVTVGGGPKELPSEAKVSFDVRGLGDPREPMHSIGIRNHKAGDWSNIQGFNDKSKAVINDLLASRGLTRADIGIAVRELHGNGHGKLSPILTMEFMGADFCDSGNDTATGEAQNIEEPTHEESADGCDGGDALVRRLGVEPS